MTLRMQYPLYNTSCRILWKIEFDLGFCFGVFLCLNTINPISNVYWPILNTVITISHRRRNHINRLLPIFSSGRDHCLSAFEL